MSPLHQAYLEWSYRKEYDQQDMQHAGESKKHMKKNSWRKCMEDFTWNPEEFNVNVIKYT